MELPLTSVLDFQVPLFKDTDDKFLRELSLKAQLYVFSPGDTIIYAGDMGREMYIIRKGICEVHDFLYIIHLCVYTYLFIYLIYLSIYNHYLC